MTLINRKKRVYIRFVRKNAQRAVRGVKGVRGKIIDHSLKFNV